MEYILDAPDQVKNLGHSHHPGRYPIWATYFSNLAINYVRDKLIEDVVCKIWQKP